MFFYLMIRLLTDVSHSKHLYQSRCSSSEIQTCKFNVKYVRKKREQGEKKYRLPNPHRTTLDTYSPRTKLTPSAVVFRDSLHLHYKKFIWMGTSSGVMVSKLA